MPTRSELAGPGVLLVTLVVEPRRPVFTDDASFWRVVQALGRAARSGICSIPAYCFMPDHVHLLIDATHTDADPWITIVEFKRMTSGQLGEGLAHWQRGCHVVYPELAGDVEAVAAYVWNNPVRADLVDDWRDYPLSGSIRLGEGREMDC